MAQKIKIVKDIIDYIKAHNIKFEMPLPKLNESWNLDKVVKYPTACDGQWVVEVSRKGAWMRIPRSLVEDQLNVCEGVEDVKEHIVYKVRHKPTGLFYQPRSSNNLSKNGKIYNSKNTIISQLSHGWVSRIYTGVKGGWIRVTADDFELVPFKLVELK